MASATTSPKASRLRGMSKAAALLVALGPELSALVLKHVNEEDIERLTAAVYGMKALPPEARDAVQSEMLHTAKAREYVLAGGVDYATEMLERAVGPDKAAMIVGRIAEHEQGIRFGFVREADPMMLLNYLQREHPQTIALILAHLPPGRASQVLEGLEPALRAEVSIRIATMGRTSPDIVTEVEEVLRKRLASMLTSNQEFTGIGGLTALVNLLKQVDRGTERSILESLERNDPKLANEIKKQMFVFANITQLDDRSIQRVLREVETKDLGLALKGANEEVRERVVHNMSERAAQMLEEDMASHGPVRLRHVEEAQGRIVSVIRNLDAAEEIIISRGGEDEILV